jgi:hypothetical protein
VIWSWTHKKLGNARQWRSAQGLVAIFRPLIDGAVADFPVAMPDQAIEQRFGMPFLRRPGVEGAAVELGQRQRQPADEVLSEQIVRLHRMHR